MAKGLPYRHSPAENEQWRIHVSFVFPEDDEPIFSNEFVIVAPQSSTPSEPTDDDDAGEEGTQ